MQMSKFSAVFAIDWFFDGLAGGRHLQCTWFVTSSKALYLCLERAKFSSATVHNGITGVARVQVEVGNS